MNGAERHRLELCCLQCLELVLAGCAPGRAVLAPRCGSLTLVVSLLGRHGFVLRCLQCLELALAGCAPGPAVLAPRCGSLTPVGSLHNRHGHGFVLGCLQSLELALPGCAPVRAVLAPLRGSLTPIVSLSDRHRRASCAAVPFACVHAGESWLSSLRSALWIARPGAQPACFRNSVLPEKTNQVLLLSVLYCALNCRFGTQPALRSFPDVLL